MTLKIAPDNEVLQTDPLNFGGDNLRSFMETVPKPPPEPDPLSFKNLKHYVKQTFELEEKVGDVFRAAAKPDCYRCNGSGVQWKPHGRTAVRCACVKVPEAV